MTKLPVDRGWWISRVVLGLLVAASPASAQEDPRAKERLELMQAALGRLAIGAEEGKPKAAFTFASKPLLRYSDPTRGIEWRPGTNVLLDAGVWRLGTEGRPTALVTVEMYKAADASHVLSFEFLSLSGAKYSLRHRTESIFWKPKGPALELKELPDAPKPAPTPAARLVQMRKLARRFEAKERYAGELITCRLLPQPIDRYQSSAEKTTEGAIFAFAHGTNPEVAVVFESDGERWRYGILRLSSAESSMTLDGREVATYEQVVGTSGTDWPYFNASFRVGKGK